jgi:hypothetical protein
VASSRGDGGRVRRVRAGAGGVRGRVTDRGGSKFSPDGLMGPKIGSRGWTIPDFDVRGHDGVARAMAMVAGGLSSTFWASGDVYGLS